MKLFCLYLYVHEHNNLDAVIKYPRSIQIAINIDRLAGILAVTINGTGCTYMLARCRVLTIGLNTVYIYGTCISQVCH